MSDTRREPTLSDLLAVLIIISALLLSMLVALVWGLVEIRVLLEAL